MQELTAPSVGLLGMPVSAMEYMFWPWSTRSGPNRAPRVGSQGWGRFPTQGHHGVVVALAGSLGTAVFTHGLPVWSTAETGLYQLCSGLS